MSLGWLWALHMIIRRWKHACPGPPKRVTYLQGKTWDFQGNVMRSCVINWQTPAVCLRWHLYSRPPMHLICKEIMKQIYLKEKFKLLQTCDTRSYPPSNVCMIITRHHRGPSNLVISQRWAWRERQSSVRWLPPTPHLSALTLPPYHSLPSPSLGQA